MKMGTVMLHSQSARTTVLLALFVAACLLALAPNVRCEPRGLVDQEARYYEHVKFVFRMGEQCPIPDNAVCGYYSMRGSATPFQIVWVDNDVAIFPGMPASALRTTGHGTDFALKWAQSADQRELSLYDWNTRTGSIVRHAPTISDACLVDGHLIYLSKQAGHVIYRIDEAVAVGKTAFRVGTASPINNTLFTQRVSHHTCKSPGESRDAPVQNNHRIVALKSRDGYFDSQPYFFRERAPQEVRYQVIQYRPGLADGYRLSYVANGRVLPLGAEDIALDPYGSMTQYIVYLNAYLLNGREIYFKPDESKRRRIGTWYKENKSYVFTC